MMFQQEMDVKACYQLYVQFERDGAVQRFDEIKQLPEDEQSQSLQLLKITSIPVPFEDFVLSFASMSREEKAEMTAIWKEGFAEWHREMETIADSIENPVSADLFNVSFDYARSMFPPEA